MQVDESAIQTDSEHFRWQAWPVCEEWFSRVQSVRWQDTGRQQAMHVVGMAAGSWHHLPSSGLLQDNGKGFSLGGCMATCPC